MKIKVALIVIVAIIAVGILVVRPDIPVDTLIARYADSASKFTALHGMTVHYKDEGAGPALVLLHGTGASLHTWDGWTEVLKKDFRVIRMDLPAFGLTGPVPDGDYTTEAYVRFVRDFLAGLGISRFSLCGNSLGGAVAWRYAVTYPFRIEALVLIDAAGYPHAMPGTLGLATVPVLNKLLTVVTPRFLVEKNVRSVYGDPENVTDAIVDRYYDMLLREGNREAMVLRLQGMRVSPERIKQIGVPTLIQWGQKDTWIPLENARHFLRDIPGAVLITYPDLGHVPMEEAPEKTAADAAAFIKRVSPNP
ncbi:MAG: alpha/beta hydrolase [Pseudomonadota bacterium]